MHLTSYLGRVIDGNRIDGVLQTFGIGRTFETYTGAKAYEKILTGDRFQLANRMEIKRSRVSGEWRIEVISTNSWYLQRQYPGIYSERIAYTNRYFIPTGEKGRQILDKILSDNPVRNAVASDDEKVQYQRRSNHSEEMIQFSWPYHSGILTWMELQKVQSAIANCSTGRYDSYDFNSSMKIAYIDGTKCLNEKVCVILVS